MEKPTPKKSPNADIKFEWNAKIERITFLTDETVDFLKTQGFQTLGDLLLRSPNRYIDRRESPPFKELKADPNSEITAIGTVESVQVTGRFNKRRLICWITDGTGHISGVWFNNYKYIQPKIVPGARIALTGKLGFYDGWQMSHPKVTVIKENSEPNVKIGWLPVYPSGTEWEKIGLTPARWEKLVQKLIAVWDGSGPYIPDITRRRMSLPDLKTVVENMHNPSDKESINSSVKAMKFTELFHHQLLMVALRRRRRIGSGMKFEVNGLMVQGLLKQLPFELSDGQNAALDEIRQDLTSGVSMYRLLQGEVGAGKTVIALLCAAIAADNGFQTAIMAPTELLARQHTENAIKWCEPLGIKTTLLAAGQGSEALSRAKYEAAIGSAKIIIGTHALFQETVQLPKLGMVVIDEQQRFGVDQRAKLVSKGSKPHVLLTTATPIPRTLALAHYGDLEMTILPPPSNFLRQVRSRVVNESKRDKVFAWIREQMQKGERGYVVFPVIDEGVAGLEAAQARYEPYSKIDFKGFKVGLVHGRQSIEERIYAMKRFREGEIQLLMATAVIEVGVDVPEASFMLVENSERFGLSQLHQLRGRIGRKGQRAVCVFMTSEQSLSGGYERLLKLETCSDGLELAEADLMLRGSGDPLGARQSGIARFKFADVVNDYQLLKVAHREAEMLLDEEPDLHSYPEIRRKLRQDYRSGPRTLQAG